MHANTGVDGWRPREPAHGIIGMRERVNLCGGTSTPAAGRRRLQVMAALPLPASLFPAASGTAGAAGRQAADVATARPAGEAGPGRT